MLHFGLLVSSSSSHAQIVKLNFWQSVIPHHALWCSLESQDSASDLDLDIKVTDFCVNSTRGIYGINLKTQNWFIFKSSYSQIWASMPTAVSAFYSWGGKKFNELKTFCSCTPLGCGFSHITPWNRCLPLLSPLTRALDLLQCVKTLQTLTLWMIWTCSLKPCFCLSCIWLSLLWCAYVIECKWNCVCLLSEGGHLLHHLQSQSRPVCHWCWGCKHRSYW